MAQSKPLFVPWLYEQIESGRYPGVCWTNEERTQFSIPWKHALRHDTNSDDVLIFKAWAQTSATADGSIPGDPSVWKRNFRSALRAKGFKMVSDKKNDDAHPHKVYQFPTDANSAGSQESQENDISQSLEESKTDLEHCLTGLNLQESPLTVSLSAVWDPEQLRFVDLTEQDLYQETSPNSQPQFTTECATGISYPVQETCDPLSSAYGAFGGDLGQSSPVEGATAVGYYSPAERTHGEVMSHPVEETVVDQGATSGATPSLETHFRVTVYYKGKKMLEQLVENEAGFRIMYQPNINPNLMQSALPVVDLPSPETILDQTQAKFTNDILGSLGGLEIRRLDGMIMGHRWGNSRAYWSLSKHEMSHTPRELSKNKPEPVYLFKDYISGLIEFIQKNGGPSPSYTLYFFLGEKWPDPKMKPWEKKLIMIEVVLTSLEDLKMMAVARGASSLQSMELQLSLEEMMELC